jgi:hypothetical protein
LALSGNGTTLTLGGYANTPGSASINNSPNRSVARVTLDGTHSVQTFSGGPHGVNQNIRSVASTDGSRFYTAGSNTGIISGTTGSGTLTTVTTTNTNNRVVGIFGSTNSLFFSASAGTNGLYAVNPGTAAPTASGQTATRIISGVNIGSFWMVDRSSSVDYAGTGLDTAYFIGTGNGIISKYEFDGTSWVSRGTSTLSGVSSTGFISGRLNGSNVELFGTFDATGGASTSNNTLYSTQDTSTFGNSIMLSGTSTISAGANYSFRGVAFVPVPEPMSLLVSGAALLGLGTLARKRRKLSNEA